MRLSKLLLLQLQCGQGAGIEELSKRTSDRALKMKSKILAGMLMKGKWDIGTDELTNVAR